MDCVGSRTTSSVSSVELSMFSSFDNETSDELPNVEATLEDDSLLFKNGMVSVISSEVMLFRSLSVEVSIDEDLMFSMLSENICSKETVLFLSYIDASEELTSRNSLEDSEIVSSVVSSSKSLFEDGDTGTSVLPSGG